MDTEIFRWTFDLDEFDEFEPKPAGSLVVTRERCTFTSGAPYHCYRVLWEDGYGNNRHEVSATLNGSSAVAEVRSQLGRVPRSSHLSIWYDLPPEDIQSAVSRAESELRSKSRDWVRQEAVRIEQKAHGGGLPIEWTDEVARGSWTSRDYVPRERGCRFDIVLLRIVRVDQGGTIQFKHRLRRETWSRRGLIGRLVGQPDQEVMKDSRIISTLRDWLALNHEFSQFQLEAQEHAYVEVRDACYLLCRARDAECKLQEEIDRRRREGISGHST